MFYHFWLGEICLLPVVQRLHRRTPYRLCNIDFCLPLSDIRRIAPTHVHSRATVMAQQASVRHLFTQVSRKLLHGSRPNFIGSYLSTISPDRFFFFFFQNFQFSIFHDFFFFSFSLTWDPTGAKIAKRYSSLKVLLNFCLQYSHKVTFRIFEILNFNEFWALLDSVTRGHILDFCPSSVVRLSVSQLSLNLMHRFLSNFGCCFSWAIRLDGFWIFEKKYAFLQIFFDFVNMGVKISKRYSSYKLQPRVFKLFLNFLPNGPHKSSFGFLRF